MLKLGKFKTLKQYFTDQKRGIRKLQHYKKKIDVIWTKTN